MNLAIFILSLFAVAGAVNEKPSLVKGHSRKIDAGDADSVASMHQLVVGARNLDITIGRRLSSPLDKLDVLIQNVDCAACMEAPPPLDPIRKLRGNGERELNSRADDVFVTALNCDSNDPYQIWNLLSLEPSGTWYLMESAETGECMELVGVCDPDGTLYDIQMTNGGCDPANTKSYWGLAGVGEIVNFECLRSNRESDTLYHSTPDIFLEAQCGNTGGMDYLDLSSHSGDSEDMAQNYWAIFPKSFGQVVTP